MAPDAVIEVASKVNREWGSHGYAIQALTEGPVYGSAIAEVWHSDGSRFFVGADRYGNSVHADERFDVAAQLRILAASQ